LVKLPRDVLAPAQIPIAARVVFVDSLEDVARALAMMVIAALVVSVAWEEAVVVAEALAVVVASEEALAVVMTTCASLSVFKYNNSVHRLMLVLQ
jgi:hypothetical protein